MIVIIDIIENILIMIIIIIIIMQYVNQDMGIKVTGIIIKSTQVILLIPPLQTSKGIMKCHVIIDAVVLIVPVVIIRSIVM